MNLQYQVADESDCSVIFEQAKNLIDTFEDPDTIDYEKVLAWVKRKITQNISQYRCVLKNAEKCAYFRLCEDGQLDDLYVLPGFQNKGIGSDILKYCIEISPKPIYLYVFSSNFGAIRFYERFGFTIREAVGKTRLIMHRNG